MGTISQTFCERVHVTLALLVACAANVALLCVFL
jgi:hypothetical protein